MNPLGRLTKILQEFQLEKPLKFENLKMNLQFWIQRERRTHEAYCSHWGSRNQNLYHIL